MNGVQHQEQGVQTEEIHEAKRIKLAEEVPEVYHLIILPSELQHHDLLEYLRLPMNTVCDFLTYVERCTMLPFGLRMSVPVGNETVQRLLNKFFVQCVEVCKIAARDPEDLDALPEDMCPRYVYEAPAWLIACLLGMFFLCYYVHLMCL